ncbi:MAG: SpoIIE family protein phosphatase [Candidatus Omnitrophota bacterium]
MNENDRVDKQIMNQQYIQTLHRDLKLKDSEAFYYSLVENIPQYIFCKDLEGRFTFVNHLFCELLEKPIDEIIGKTDYDFFPDKLAKKYRDDDRRVIEENRTFEDVEENKVSSHETKYVHVVKTPIHDANGNIIGIQGIFWDITQRKKAEEELKNANERMRRDLIAAAKVQRGFIPEKAPKIPGFRFSWLFEPSEYIGGDILNVIRLDEKRWAFYVLDVSGHGVPAALLSVSLTRMIDQTSISIGPAHDENLSMMASDELYDPQKVVQKLNRRFPGDDATFCTLLYAILNVQDASVTWIRAGHVPPLLIQQNGKKAEYLYEPAGIFISNMYYEDENLQTSKIMLEPGDRFVLFSDGITEAMKNYQEFGFDRFADVMLDAASLPLELSIHSALSSVSEWTGVSKFDDDVTLLALERIHNEG